MDVKQKKTALDDDSILYQKRDDTIGKKDISSLSGRQKLQYFKDYYLKFCILAVVLIAIGTNLVYTIFFRHQETILNITAVNEAALADADDLAAFLKSSFQATGKDQILTVTNYNLDDANQQMAFTTKLVTSDLDVIICDRETFDSKSEAGFCLDLSSVLTDDLLATFSDHLVTGQIVERDNDDQVISTGEELPYGIDISDTALYTYYGGTASEAILMITAGSEHQDNALEFIRLLADWTAPSSQESEAAPAESQ